MLNNKLVSEFIQATDIKNKLFKQKQCDDN